MAMNPRIFLVLGLGTAVAVAGASAANRPVRVLVVGDSVASTLSYEPSMESGIAYVIGPGRSAKGVMSALGFETPLLGVDLVLDRRLLGSDLAEAELMRLTDGRKVGIIVGVTGGQGFIFGRGNQPISPALIRRTGRAGLTVLAGPRKLAGLPDRRLLLDTGDPALDQSLQGYLRIVTGPGLEAVMRASAA